MISLWTPYAFFLWFSFDEFATVSGVGFLDLDLDAKELGGSLQWSPPITSSSVEFYKVYLASDRKI